MGCSNGNGDRRKYPRIIMELPIEWKISDLPVVHGALTVNLSETGFLIESGSDLPVGEKLSLIVLFPKEFALKSLEASAEIVWKEIYWSHWTEVDLPTAMTASPHTPGISSKVCQTLI